MVAGVVGEGEGGPESEGVGVGGFCGVRWGDGGSGGWRGVERVGVGQWWWRIVVVEWEALGIGRDGCDECVSGCDEYGRGDDCHESHPRRVGCEGV